MNNLLVPELVSDLVLIRALNRQSDAARAQDRLDRAELLNRLFRNYLAVRYALNSRFEEALAQTNPSP
jgi:hypothetical protein